MVVLDRLEHLGVLVCRLDERLSLALENTLSAGSRRVNERRDLETGTELVLESERVAKVNIALGPHGFRLTSRVPHQIRT